MSVASPATTSMSTPGRPDRLMPRTSYNERDDGTGLGVGIGGSNIHRPSAPGIFHRHSPAAAANRTSNTHSSAAYHQGCASSLGYMQVPTLHRQLLQHVGVSISGVNASIISRVSATGIGPGNDSRISGSGTSGSGAVVVSGSGTPQQQQLQRELMKSKSMYTQQHQQAQSQQQQQQLLLHGLQGGSPRSGSMPRRARANSLLQPQGSGNGYGFGLMPVSPGGPGGGAGSSGVISGSAAYVASGTYQRQGSHGSPGLATNSRPGYGLGAASPAAASPGQSYYHYQLQLQQQQQQQGNGAAGTPGGSEFGAGTPGGGGGGGQGSDSQRSRSNSNIIAPMKALRRHGLTAGNMGVVARGPRIRCGMSLGTVMTNVSGVTGRLNYRGKVMNRAARISLKAGEGQVMCDEDVWLAAHAAQTELLLAGGASQYGQGRTSDMSQLGFSGIAVRQVSDMSAAAGGGVGGTAAGIFTGTGGTGVTAGIGTGTGTGGGGGSEAVGACKGVPAGRPFRSQYMGAMALKGISDPLDLYLVEW